MGTAWRLERLAREASLFEFAKFEFYLERLSRIAKKR
ncbi:protein of unknown function [Paraburkholderia dioscoreae]|uniref:Uncharacterized protein n=1 Tax=Paraburkholderia dioscoreae TaxID=2604047 RepID=A0A5Q4YWH1_9BURK|nr:protein of unknown function [Paraburkholderia dioscoreae]